MDKIERIKATHAAALFAPFQNSLQEQNSLSRPSFWEILSNLDRKFSDPRDLKKIDILHLFALLLAPDSREPSKKAAIETYLASLTESDKEVFLYELSNNMPPCIALSILRHTSPELRQEICNQSVRHRSVRNFEEGPCGWIKEIATNPDLYPEGTNRLDQLFECYSETHQKELIYYFLLHSNASEQQAFFDTSSSTLRIETEKACQIVETFLTTALNASTQIPFEGRQRDYFLHLFFTKALDSPEGFLIVASFEEKDWCQLKAHAKEPLTTNLILRWMHQMVQFISEKEQEFPLSKSRIRLFFYYASNILPDQLSSAQRLGVQKIVRTFSPTLLAIYYNAFEKSFFLKELSSQQIIDLFSLSITKKKNPEEIWTKITSAQGFESICNLCFLQQNNPLFELTIYSSLSQQERLEILAMILKDREQGVKTLANWCTYYLSSDSEIELTSSAKFMFQQLHKTIAEIDESIPVLLRAQLERLQVSPDELNGLLPEASCAPQERQQQAFDQLEQLLSKKEIEHQALRSLIDCLMKDLQAGTEPTTWIPKLFDRLPERMWPLLFLYFADYMEDAMQKKPSPLPSSPPAEFLNSEKWIKLTAQTLVEIVDNPLLDINDSKTSWVLRYLYEGSCETKTIALIITRFSSIAPSEKWIPALAALQRSVFHRNEEEFYELIANSLSDLPPKNKADFIAERFIAFDQTRSSQRRIISGLETHLFKKPFIQTVEEGSSLVDSLIQRLGIHFLEYFLRGSIDTETLVKAVKATQNQGRATILDWLTALVLANNENSIKIQILESIASDYSTQYSEEFIDLLKEPPFTAIAETIRSWYPSDTENLKHPIQSSLTGWRLLIHFHPNAFYPTICRKLTDQQKKNDWFAVAEIFYDLSSLPCKEEIIKQMLTEDSFRTAFQNHVQAEGIQSVLCSFLCSSEIGRRLTFAFIPNWSSLLIPWTIQELQTAYDSISYSDLRNPPYQLISLYEALDKAGVLSSWLSCLEEALPKGLHQDFLRVNRAYQQQKTKAPNL